MVGELELELRSRILPDCHKILLLALAHKAKRRELSPALFAVALELTGPLSDRRRERNSIGQVSGLAEGPRERLVEIDTLHCTTPLPDLESQPDRRGMTRTVLIPRTAIVSHSENLTRR